MEYLDTPLFINTMTEAYLDLQVITNINIVEYWYFKDRLIKNYLVANIFSIVESGLVEIRNISFWTTTISVHVLGIFYVNTRL